MATALNPRLRDGIAAAKARDFERARSLLESVTATSPNEAMAWFWLAIVSPSAEKAIPALRKVVEIDDSHTQARQALAKLLVSQAGNAAAAGNRKEARACAAEATELLPDDDAGWLALASVSDDRAERLDALRRAFAANPQPATRTRLRRTLLYYAVMATDTDRADARTLFREAAALEPADAHVWQALIQLADTPAEALQVVREFVRAVPDDAEGRTLLKKALAADARALESAGDRQTACDRWREAVDVDAGDIDAWLALAETTEDDDEARRALEAASEINPSDERVAAGWARVKEVVVDPAALEPPPDAFARLEPSADVFAGLDATPDAFAKFDLAADPFARFEAARPAATDREAAAEPEKAPALPAPESRAAERDVELAPAVEVPLGPAPWVEPAAPFVEEAAPAPEPAVEMPESEPIETAPMPEPAAVVEPAVEPVVEPPVAAPVAEAPAAVEAVPAPRPAAVEAAAAAPAPLRAPGDNGSRRTIMVVDDSPTIRKILGLTLERAGYKVVAEPDGESAIERLIHVVPDVILLDISMPKLDGYEVCRRIKKDPRTSHVPVVMLSGKDALFDKVKGHMAGATEYLTKPFETPAVLAAVSHACQPASGVVDG